MWPACFTATNIVCFSGSQSSENIWKFFFFGGGGGGGIVSIVTRTTEESFQVLAGVKFFLQAISMDWGPPSLLLCGYGKFSGQKLKLTIHLSQHLHSPIHLHGMNRNSFTLIIANVCISHYCKWNILIYNVTFDILMAVLSKFQDVWAVAQSRHKLLTVKWYPF